MQERFAEVVLTLPLRRSLIYRLPNGLLEKAHPGSLVKVSLGSRRLIGCLLEINDKKPAFPTKDILEILDEEPLLSATEIRLLRWASEYYLTPIGEVLRHLAPPRCFQSKKSYRRSKPMPDLGGFLHPPSPNLNSEQKQALEIIQNSPHQPILLHGITGSGKTEIYLEVVRKVLQDGGQALVLVPEIGLTPQLVGRFQGISDATSVYHSRLTDAQRFQVWKNAREGKSQVVIATRSGIFLRFPNLKLIVIDEEHDSSYKQEERFCYHARDLALWRGDQENLLVVLGSATPSLETLNRASQGKIKLARLRERPSGISLPPIQMIDRRKQKGGHPFFSEELLKALEENLKQREQSLLFLNRRGFAPFVLCRSCGHVPQCDQCDISLTLHGHGKLICHYCDACRPFPSVCPQCQKGTLSPFGFGTERLDADLRKIFPKARVARMDRDTAKGEGWLKILEKMKNGEIDILVGTQMITKGHDYPNLTLVGILDSDLALHLPDFRAAERTFQLITQVSGRAGRRERAGRVLIQTFHPDHESLVAAATYDGEKFYSRELRQRQEAGYPPFRRLVEIRLSGTQGQHVIQKMRLLGAKLSKSLPSQLVTLLGPSPCPVERVRGKTRWKLLLKTSQYTNIQPQLHRLLDAFIENDLPSKMKLLVNVDPVEMI